MCITVNNKCYIVWIALVVQYTDVTNIKLYICLFRGITLRGLTSHQISPTEHLFNLNKCNNKCPLINVTKNVFLGIKESYYAKL